MSTHYLLPQDPVALTTDPADLGLPDEPDLVLRDVNGHTALVRGSTFNGGRTDYFVPVDSLRADVRDTQPQGLPDTELACLHILVDAYPRPVTKHDVARQMEAYLGESRYMGTINKALRRFAAWGWVTVGERPSGAKGPNPQTYRLK